MSELLVAVRLDKGRLGTRAVSRPHPDRTAAKRMESAWPMSSGVNARSNGDDITRDNTRIPGKEDLDDDLSLPPQVRSMHIGLTEEDPRMAGVGSAAFRQQKGEPRKVKIVAYGGNSR